MPRVRFNLIRSTLLNTTNDGFPSTQKWVKGFAHAQANFQGESHEFPIYGTMYKGTFYFRADTKSHIPKVYELDMLFGSGADLNTTVVMVVDMNRSRVVFSDMSKDYFDVADE